MVLASICIAALTAEQLSQGSHLLQQPAVADIIVTGERVLRPLSRTPSSVTVFTAGSIACGLAPSLPWLIAGRVLQGVGGGITQPSGTALLYRAFPPSRCKLASTSSRLPATLRVPWVWFKLAITCRLFRVNAGGKRRVRADGSVAA